ncbi:MAG: TIGR00300 family protein [candidate division Zixibacteria bacterium]|nr:TIGR00300 family protein [candidate division Zixibacteria bacterium]
MKTQKEIIAKGHLVDSGIMSEILDRIVTAGGTFEILSFRMGKTNEEESAARLKVFAPNEKKLEFILSELSHLGCRPAEEASVTLKKGPKAGAAPEGFYSTTNHETWVRLDRNWTKVGEQRMDASIVVKGKKAFCCKLRDLKKGDSVVMGHEGIRIVPEAKSRDRSEFSFMSNEVSSERKVELSVKKIAKLLKDKNERLVVVAGPVVVHTGGGPALCKLLRKGYVRALLAGNALAVHDIEEALYGTSLGVDTKTGRPIEHGHQHHMRAINAICLASGIAPAVRKGVLKSGIMHQCVKSKVPFVLAGSLRDDGPLPEVITDLIEAQAAYGKYLKNATIVLMLSSMLHSIAVGNMLPSWVKTICVDINPAVVTKLSDRGSSQAWGVVTDVGLFLHLLAREL